MKARAMNIAAIIRNGGPSRPTIFRVLNEPGYIPESYSIERLARALEVSTEWLHTGEGSMSRTLDPTPGIQAIMDAAAETPEPYRADAPPPLNVALLREVVQAVLEEGTVGQTPAEIANQVAAAYEFIQRTGKLSKVREVVRMGIS